MQLKRPTLRRPSASLLMSSAALVVALGGTSYAAATIGSADIRNGAVTSPKIKDGTIKRIDLSQGLRNGLQGQRGPQGPRGAQGEAGPAGPAGVGRWALVGMDGQIVAQSGGFTVTSAYPTLPNTAVAPAPDNSLRANGNVYINANEDLANNGIVATVVLQNTIEQDNNSNTNGRATGSDANAEFSGEIAVSRCAFTGSVGIPTNCAPTGTNTASTFVVSPRLSDGSVTTTTNRKMFYVIITGDSTDVVAPTP